MGMAQPQTESNREPSLHWRHLLVNIFSPSIVTFALFLALIFLVIIPTMKRTIIDRKKEMIRELTQAAWSELAGLHEQELSGSLDRSSAQQAAKARIQKLRYGDDGKDYFWISDMRPFMVMHPYRPDLDGQDLSELPGSRGQKAVRRLGGGGSGARATATSSTCGSGRTTRSAWYPSFPT